MTPIGWGYAAFVWGYALAWFLVTDRVKLLAYRILDPMKTKTPSNVTLQLAKVSR
jgi:H+-transporting ATPase